MTNHYKEMYKLAIKAFEDKKCYITTTEEEEEYLDHMILYCQDYLDDYEAFERCIERFRQGSLLKKGEETINE